MKLAWILHIGEFFHVPGIGEFFYDPQISSHVLAMTPLSGNKALTKRLFFWNLFYQDWHMCLCTVFANIVFVQWKLINVQNAT